MAEIRMRIVFAGLLMTCVAATSGDVAIDQVDQSVAAGDNFYTHANGVWLRQTQLPKGVGRVDSTALLRRKNALRVGEIIDDAVKAAHDPKQAQRPDSRKLANYFLSLSDTADIDAKGLAPLANDLAAIAAIADRRALAAALGRTVSLDDGSNQQTESLLGLWVHQNFHDPDHYAAHLVQGGLGLSNAADYLVPEADAAARRSEYRRHIATVFGLAGYGDADARADRVVALETAIARTHASRADTDDVFKTDNIWHHADFAAKAPGIDWATYFAAAGLDRAPSFNIWQPQAVAGSSRLVATEPLESWKDYLAFHLIERSKSALPKPYGGTPGGANARIATETAFGDALGRLYVERHFPPHRKLAANAMVGNIRTAFGSHLSDLTWMTGATKTKALGKLAALKIGLGYPDTWVDYSALLVVRGDALGNLQRSERFAYARELAKLSQPVDPDEWAGQLYPQMAGAVLNISPNTMQFAAGLLQPPYFDADGDSAANYGSAGAGITHEISHSFDELGNQYDAQGRLGVWWTKADFAGYRAAAASLSSQLEACVVAAGMTVNGAQVVTESSADLGGLAIAYDAYRLSLRGQPDVLKNGLTGDQRFFLAFARRWRRLQTAADLTAQNAGDNHALPQCRGNLVQNSDAWVRAFSVKSADRLFLTPKSRVQIW